MEFETEYQLQNFRHEQNELFDHKGKAFERISHAEPMTRMLALINQMEKEIKSLEKNQIDKAMISAIYDAFEKLGAPANLLSAIGSYKDTMPDEWCLNELEKFTK